MLEFLLLLLFDAVPLFIVMKLIGKRARSARVKPERHLYAAVLGWGLGLVLLHATTIVLVVQLARHEGERFEWIFLTWVPTGLFGGTVGALASYLHLRMQTARDPDYEDRTEPQKPSLEADVPQARDGDHVGPD